MTEKRIEFVDPCQRTFETQRAIIDLETEKLRIEMSDDQCYSNGRVAAINAQIADLQKKLTPT